MYSTWFLFQQSSNKPTPKHLQQGMKSRRADGSSNLFMSLILQNTLKTKYSQAQTSILRSEIDRTQAELLEKKESVMKTHFGKCIKKLKVNHAPQPAEPEIP